MSDIEGAQDAPAPNEAETEARKMGWVGKDEFKGNPDNWRPAEEFLDRGKRILPIVLKDNERLQRNLERVKDELKELRDSTKQLVEFHTEAAKREYERGRREIEAKIEAATANADTATVRQEMQNLDALTKQNTPKKVEPAQPQTIQIDPEIQDWISKESWFNRDRALNGYAIDQFELVQREKPGLTTAEVLAETKRRTVSKFPEKFGINPEREGAAAVATPNGGGAPVRRNAKSYENLPADAKHACDKFVKTIPGYTKEKYVADYDWDS
jgi:ElaB/YqjD/DUF883 family membrane-anchored ribosome-binding protein